MKIRWRPCCQADWQMRSWEKILHLPSNDGWIVYFPLWRERMNFHHVCMIFWGALLAPQHSYMVSPRYINLVFHFAQYVTFCLMLVTWSAGTFFNLSWTEAMIWGTGIFVGAGANLRPLDRTESWDIDRVFDDRLTTHWSFPTGWGLSLIKSTSNFLFSRVRYMFRSRFDVLV